MQDRIFIAAVNKDKADASFQLGAFVDALASSDDLTLISETDSFVRFSGPAEAVETITADFLDSVLIEEDSKLTAIDPLPRPPIAPSAPASADDDDDKDPNEIVQF
ncbi:MAG: hypothetical protein P8P56_10495 [Yoonia sp.]|nr:hypothetical protein [Yoonia sp.]